MIAFALTGGRLVVSNGGRPVADYPAEDARALCKANDPNGDWDYLDRECSRCHGGECGHVDDDSRSYGGDCALCRAAPARPCEHCNGDGREPVPTELCVAVLNTWVIEDPAESATTGRLFAAWLANDAEAFQALTGRPRWAGRGGAP